MPKNIQYELEKSLNAQQQQTPVSPSYQLDASLRSKELLEHAAKLAHGFNKQKKQQQNRRNKDEHVDEDAAENDDNDENDDDTAQNEESAAKRFKI